MAKFNADALDVPMSLGDHLDELRRRLIWPLIILGIGFFTAFFYEARLQGIFAQPMAWATMLYPDQAKAVGLPNDGTLPKFMIHGVMEGPMSSMLVSFYTAFFVAFPVLVYQLWQFIGVGLVPRERRLAFLFVPAGIMFFYAGTVFGYFIGLPYYYGFMIKWTANNPIAQFNLQLTGYHHSFVFMTMVFGLIMDIPWLIMVLVRVGFVTVRQLITHWKAAIMINTAISAVVAPPDAISMIAMMIPLIGLYIVGVGLAYVMMWHHRRMTAKEDAAELARMAEEERAAHQAQVPREDPSTAGAQPAEVHLDPAQPQATDQGHPSVVGDPQPISRDAITDDLNAGDQAPSSADQLASEPDTSVTPGTSEELPPQPPADQPRLGNDESGMGGETPRKDDDRG
jgi:sec-independent protein translocase protein TatC